MIISKSHLKNLNVIIQQFNIENIHQKNVSFNPKESQKILKNPKSLRHANHLSVNLNLNLRQSNNANGKGSWRILFGFVWVCVCMCVVSVVGETTK